VVCESGAGACVAGVGGGGLQLALVGRPLLGREEPAGELGGVLDLRDVVSARELARLQSGKVKLTPS
jgi:hypothetical protein